MKTVILAGGLGTRLSEETQVKPKPMVEVGEMPILQHIMKIYSHHGFKEFVVALGYKGEVIKEYFNHYVTRNSDLVVDLENGTTKKLNKTQDDFKVHLIDTGKDSMTGGRLYRLKDYLKDEDTFMLTYGDGVSNIDVKSLVEFHKSHGKIGTVTAVRPPARFGALHFDGDKVIEFHEKPQVGEGWINGGFFVFNKKFLEYVNDDSDILEKAPLETLAKSGELMSFKHEDFWHPMDTLRDKNLLNDLWNSGKAPWKMWNE